MAQRRMFSPDIVCSDAFLEMPASTQALYYQLGMRADDDGFVNPRGAMRLVNASEDDLKILCAKNFVLPFENGVIVIKHWRMNNLVRKDWYKPTIYTEFKPLLYLKENGAYTLDSSKGIPLVNESLTVRTHRLGKVRLIDTSSAEPLRVEKITDDEKPTKRSNAKYPHSKEVFALFPNPQLSWSRNTTELENAEFLYARGLDKVRAAVVFIQKHKGEPFLPKVTKPSDLERKWVDLAEYHA